ncbi:TIGR02285 family protein [Pseudomonas syringae pv. actinidifoliorum]|nr:TIGR02285 family protein [Pseudomonas syringae pv. actinidifoliorum]MDU8519144.1 TIGR02285 family protein [Pseudomonas syringae pv. actinidifoliorum]MDU8525086.1 TIGR02285 family protein [Pseudomonas syringae pv. actinidifoliorum]
MLALSLVALSCASQARETLTWLMRDIPPSTIFSGTMRGQGAIDQLMPLLTARMPEYDHVLMRVNRARSLQMLNDASSLNCDPTMLWTAERAKTLLFSIPIVAIISSGLIVRKEEMSTFEPYMADGKIDFAALMASNAIKLGVVAERSYGELIDHTLQSVNENALIEHYGNDATGSLLQMERLGRLQAFVSFWPEARYQAMQQGISPDELSFLPVQGNPAYQFIYISCSHTPEGEQAIAKINQQMRELRESSLMDFYAQWLDPSQRASYLEDVKALFQQH